MKESPMNKKSLKKSLAFTFLMAVILPFLLLVVATLVTSFRILDKEIEEKNIQLANLVAVTIDRSLLNIKHELEGVVTFLDIKALDPGKINSYLNDLLGRHTEFSGLQIVSHSGKVLFTAPADPSVVGNDVSYYAFFQELSEKNPIHWSWSFQSLQTNLPTVTVSLYLPGYILTASLDLNQIISHFDEVADEGKLIIAVLDQQGTFVFHSDKKKVKESDMEKNFFLLKSISSSRVTKFSFEIDNQDFFYYARKIKTAGWTIIVYKLESEVYRPIYNLILWLLAAAIPLFVYVFIYLLAKIQILSQTVYELILHTKKVAGGEYDFFIKPSNFLEVNELMDNFNTMAKNIKSRQLEIIESRRQLRKAQIIARIGAFEYYPQEDKIILENDLLSWLSIMPEDYDHCAKSFFDLIHKDDLKKVMEIFQASQRGNDLVEFSCRVLLPDGVIKYLFISFEKNNVSEKIKGIIQDISHQREEEAQMRELENQLVHAQKNEAIGNLASGIAHDFNNILSGILGNVEIMQMNLADSHPAYEYLKGINQAIFRAKDLTRQILTFARKTEVEYALVEVSALLEETIKLFKVTVSPQVKIEVNIPDSKIYIKGNDTSIQQVIMNLGTNAYHALEGKGGMISFALRKEYVENHPTLSTGYYVVLSVKDTGVGIDPCNMSKIFEPYFTTKDVGKGTGLGLSVTKAIIDKHRGEISVESELGCGSTFQLYLPVVDYNINLFAKKSDDLVLKTHLGRILLVDDEEMILRVLEKLLEKLGYEVRPFTKPVEAIKEFYDDPYYYDLIITDHTMPEMSGLDIAVKAREIRRDVPIILCTGHIELMTNLQDGSVINRLLYKPVSIKEMIKVISELI